VMSRFVTQYIVGTFIDVVFSIIKGLLNVLSFASYLTYAFKLSDLCCLMSSSIPNLLWWLFVTALPFSFLFFFLFFRFISMFFL
jgi:hypothetical protein